MNNKTKKYLIVDDDDDHAALIERNLRRESPTSEVDRVSDGNSALQYLRAEGSFSDRSRPDLVLLDLKLPGLNGIRVLEFVKQDESLRTIPVIMLTTSAADGDREQAYRNHVNSYLVKPMEFSGFRDLVREICHYWGEVNCPSAE